MNMYIYQKGKKSEKLPVGALSLFCEGVKALSGKDLFVIYFFIESIFTECLLCVGYCARVGVRINRKFPVPYVCKL